MASAGGRGGTFIKGTNTEGPCGFSSALYLLQNPQAGVFGKGLESLYGLYGRGQQASHVEGTLETPARVAAL